MKKFKCEKHGLLEPEHRAVWSKSQNGRWCIFCMNELMDKFCGPVIEIEEDEIKS